MLQLAQTLEQSGEWQQASELYLALWSNDSTNYVYFDALRRAYGQLKQYDKAVDLIERRLRQRPQEVHLMASLGGVLYDAGRLTAADSVWNALLSMRPAPRQMFVLVAQQMMERRLYDKAEETYRRGRTTTKNPADFAEELAMLYSARQEYGEAVGEYLRILRSAPHQIGYIQSRIASFTFRSEGLAQARRVIENEVASRADDIAIRTLFAWVLMEQGDYDAALDVTRELDHLAAAGGNELFAFAERAFREGKYEVAARSYGELAGRTAPSPLRPAALLGLGRTLERRTALESAEGQSPQDSNRVLESPFSPDSALRVYKDVIDQYPGAPQAIHAQYRSGIVLFEKYFDLDAASASFDLVRKNPRSGPLSWDALMMEVDILLARGDIEGAARTLSSIPETGQRALGDTYLLKHAWVLYLSGSFTKALEVLERLSESLERDGANDAMELQYHIVESLADSANLAFFARGEALIRRRAYAEAKEVFIAVSRSARTTGLSSRARLRSSDMSLHVGDVRGCIALLDSIVRTMPEDPNRDIAHFRLAETYERHLRDRVRALELYESFLLRHPSSLLTEEARKRVRRLRGDVS